MASVLFVGQDPALKQLADHLNARGLMARTAPRWPGTEQVLAQPTDLVVLDTPHVADEDLALCGQLRQKGHLGIVLCGSVEERRGRILSLNAGADAYLPKPLDADEMTATLGSVYRRLLPAKRAEQQASPEAVDTTPWQLDLVQHRLIAPNGQSLQLHAGELTVMETLLDAERHAVPRDDLLLRLEHEVRPGSKHRLEALISRLRRRVLSATSTKLPLLSSYGRGYAFAGHGEILAHDN